jgi:Domain of unknown function (DUF4337)
VAEATKLSRSEREAQIKDKAGWVITVLAALLAINTLMSNSNSSRVLNDTMTINDTWNFYQAKSIKQTVYELASAQTTGEKSKKYAEKAASYESDPKTGEGKKELLAKARGLEQDRAVAKQKSPWYTYAGSLLQIAIVLLTASILAVSNRMYWASIGVGTFGFLFMSQAIWLWMPLIM